MENNTGRGFKRKTIISILRNKMNHYLKAIEDEEVRLLIKKNYIITGGAITSLLLGEEPNDYDIYFRDYDSAKKIAEYYVKKVQPANGKVTALVDPRNTTNDRIRINIKSAGIIRGEDDKCEDYDYFETTDGSGVSSYLNKKAVKGKGAYEIAMITSNAVSLTDSIQLIFRFVGSPAEIHKNYDFVHVTNYFTEDEGLVINPDALEAIMSKTLRYIGSRYPICSMFRTRKFINRGWTVNAGEMLKIAWDINGLDLKNKDVLYDQLIGVDVAYFQQLIGHLEEFQKTGKADFGRDYFFELINKVFDEADEVDE